MRDPLYAMLERRKNWIKISFLLWLAYSAAGYGGVMALAEVRVKRYNLAAVLPSGAAR